MSSADLEPIADYSRRDYHTVWQGPKAEFEDRFERKLIEQMVPRSPGWFMDLGAGYGRVYPFYARPGRKVILVDYAVEQLEVAAESLQFDDVYLVAANAYHLPFRAGVFDAGISIRTFHHMAKPERFLDELGRVLRRRASFLLEYSNKRNLLKLVRYGPKTLRKNHEEYGTGDLLFGIHPKHFAELSSNAGLSVSRTRGTGFMSRVVGERTRALVPALAVGESALDLLCGRTGLAPMNFVELQKTTGEDGSASPELADLLQCPACGSNVEENADGMHCTACDHVYPKVGKVLDFRYVGRR
jgi:SAM-dependent methyltransferase